MGKLRAKRIAADVDGAATTDAERPRKKIKKVASVEVQSKEVVLAADVVGAVQGSKKKKRKVQSATTDSTEAVINSSTAADPVDGASGAIAGKRSGKKLAKLRKHRQQVQADEPEQSAGAVAASAPAAPAASSKACSGDAERTVFVDGVPYDWTADKVNELFKSCGDVLNVKAPMWQDSGRLRGYAHVTFKSLAARNKALKMNGHVIKKGRYLKIDPAMGQKEAGSQVSLDVEGKRRLFVKNLPYDASENEIGKLFGSFGKVREVRIPTNAGRSKGFAYVEFAKAESLKAAVDKRPVVLRGRELRLDVDTASGPKAGFHYRPEAYESKFGPKGGGKGGVGRGRGASGGKGGGRADHPAKLSLL